MNEFVNGRMRGFCEVLWGTMMVQLKRYVSAGFHLFINWEKTVAISKKKKKKTAQNNMIVNNDRWQKCNLLLLLCDDAV